MSQDVIAGNHAVEEALRGRRKVQALYVDNRHHNHPLLALAKNAGIKIEFLSSEELDQRADGARHQGMLALVDAFAYLEEEDVLALLEPQKFILALDQITDPQNLGAMIRSAVAFGALAIVVLKDRSAHITPAVVRASSGATEHARIAMVTNLARFLRSAQKAGCSIVGLDGEAQQNLRDILQNVSMPLVLVIGSEGQGLRRLVAESCDQLARIPQHHLPASLNAASAAAIACYEAAQLVMSKSHAQR